MSHLSARTLAAACFVLAVLPLVAARAADSADPFAAQLDEARERHQKAAAAADAAAVKAIERQSNAALNRGDLAASKRLEAVRDKLKSSGRFDAGDASAPLKRARQDWATARQRAAENLVAALDHAIKGYAKSRQLDKAEALRRERDALARQAGAAGSMADGLVLHLSFEPQAVEKDGDQVTVRDLSGNANDGVQRGTVRSARDGAVGAAASFDGRGADINCGDGPSLRLTGAVTVSAFVRLTVPGATTGPIVSKDDWKEDNHAHGFVLRVLDGRPNFTIGAGEWHEAMARAALKPGRWYHLAGTFDGRQLRLYVDGQEAATEAAESKIEPSPFPLTIARGTYDRARIFTGDVDEVTVFERPLSPDEIRELARRK